MAFAHNTIFYGFIIIWHRCVRFISHGSVDHIHHTVSVTGTQVLAFHFITRIASPAFLAHTLTKDAFSTKVTKVRAGWDITSNTFPTLVASAIAVIREPILLPTLTVTGTGSCLRFFSGASDAITVCIGPTFFTHARWVTGCVLADTVSTAHVWACFLLACRAAKITPAVTRSIETVTVSTTLLWACFHIT